MAWIPEEEIERVKSTVDLAAVVRARGIDLKKHGTGNLVGFCPFHEDKKTPNLIVTPGKGLFRCMSCGTAGNVIQFVEKFDGISFRHAFELLAEGRFEDVAASDGVRRKKGKVPKLPPPVDLEAEGPELLGQVCAYYHQRLLGPLGGPGRELLARRGIDNEALIKNFGLGIADRSIGMRLPGAAWKTGRKIRDALKACGLYRDNGREHLRGCVVVPIRDEDGTVLGLYGRRVGGDGEGGVKHLYLPGPHRGIFNVEALTNREVILCEAILDALSFWHHGIRNVTSTYGTEGFTDELLKALVKARVQSVRIAFDADEAGERAAGKAAKRLRAVGIECHRIKLPWGEDVNSFALKSQNPAEALAAAVNGAEFLGKGRVARASSLVASTAASPAQQDATTAAPDAAKKESSSEGMEESTPQPKAGAGPEVEQRGEHWHVTIGDRAYRVGGLERNAGFESLKITLRLWHDDLFHLDSFDLCGDGQRRKFIERAAEETTLDPELIKRDLGRLLLVLEQLQEKRLAGEDEAAEAVPDMTPEQREAAEALLDAPDLMERIGADFETCGMVGEGANRLVGYLACTSRLLERPLAVIIQSTSAAGKSTLMEAVLAMFPEEQRIKYSAMTGQSLYYLGESNIKHKILAIVEEEGAERASYALKLLQSEGELTIASTGKNPKTGQMETQTYHVEGPVMIFLTTTAIDIDEELQNRCLTLTVDESRDQTRRIHEAQRRARTLEGILQREVRRDVLQVHRDAQRLLKAYPVWNPYVEQLTFTSERTRTRRDHEKYLSLIDAVTLLHQKQRRLEGREVAGRNVEALVATIEDIRTANRLAPEVLGRSLDELPPQTRKLWNAVKSIVGDAAGKGGDWKRVIFTRRQVCGATGWSLTQVRVHLDRLTELEYIHVPRGGRGGLRFEYHCLLDPRAEQSMTHIGLIDPDKLRDYDGNPTGSGPHLTGQNGHLAGGDESTPSPSKPLKTSALSAT